MQHVQRNRPQGLMDVQSNSFQESTPLSRENASSLQVKSAISGLSLGMLLPLLSSPFPMRPTEKSLNANYQVADIVLRSLDTLVMNLGSSADSHHRYPTLFTYFPMLVYQEIINFLVEFYLGNPCFIEWIALLDQKSERDHSLRLIEPLVREFVEAWRENFPVSGEPVNSAVVNLKGWSHLSEVASRISTTFLACKTVISTATTTGAGGVRYRINAMLFMVLPLEVWCVVAACVLCIVLAVTLALSLEQGAIRIGLSVFFGITGVLLSILLGVLTQQSLQRSRRVHSSLFRLLGLIDSPSSAIVEVDPVVRATPKHTENESDEYATLLSAPTLPIDDTIIRIGVDENFNVCLWNRCASRLCSLSSDEVIGEHILTVISETSFNLLEERDPELATDAALNIFLRNRNGTQILVRGSFFFSSGNLKPECPCYAVLFAAPGDDIIRGNELWASTRLSMQIRRSLQFAITASTDEKVTRHARHASTLASLCSDTDLVRIAQRITHKWSPATLASVVSDMSRHISNCEFKASYSVPEPFELDLECLLRIMLTLSRHVKHSRCQVTVRFVSNSQILDSSFTPSTEAVGANLMEVDGCLIIQLLCANTEDANHMEEVALSADLRSLMERSAIGVCPISSGGTVEVCCPTRKRRGGELNVGVSGPMSTGSSCSALFTSSSVAGGNEDHSMSFLMFEPIQRHKLISTTTILDLGHSILRVESRASTQKIFRATAQIDVCLVNVDTAEGVEIYNMCLQQQSTRNIVVAPLSARKSIPDTIKLVGAPLVTKPLRRAVVSQLVKFAEQRRFEAAQKTTALGKTRPAIPVFQVHRQAPWEKLRPLGHGSNAEVFEALNVLTKGRMAVKMFSLLDEDVVQNLSNEIEIMCELEHPHIVRYFYCEQTPTAINLFMELCEGGTLRGYLDANNGKLRFEDSIIVLQQLLDALRYLHSKDIVHRDVKPENILLVSKGKLDNIKITDFGTAQRVARGNELTDTTGTFKYMAPEVFNGEPYGTACDLWSLGIVVLETLGLTAPFLKNLDFFGLSDFYSKLHPTQVLPLPKDLTGEVADFIRRCIQVDPCNRLSAEDLLSHPLLMSDRSTLQRPVVVGAGASESVTRDGPAVPLFLPERPPSKGDSPSVVASHLVSRRSPRAQQSSEGDNPNSQSSILVPQLHFGGDVQESDE